MESSDEDDSQAPGHWLVLAWRGVSFACQTSSDPDADGHSVCIFSIVRAIYVASVSKKQFNYDVTCKSTEVLDRERIPVEFQLNPVGNAVQGSIWSDIEMATAVISACLPTLRPIFMKRTTDSRTGYIHRDLSVTVTSDRRRPGDIELSERHPTHKIWADSTISSHSRDRDERPFVRLEGRDEASI